MCEYIVETRSGKVITGGKLLSELIEQIVFLKINEIERNTNILIRLDKGIYKYLNQLSCFYNLSDINAEVIEQDWNYINNFLNIYNQKEYINESDFITIKRELKVND
ncbi:hypothetical protein ACN0TX_12200 [Staphylococcus cohnii]|uniref:hypothetical protein n=1 Tax=Staphylococcus cohnii TaxID=29382 RepID=UPI003AF72D6C